MSRERIETGPIHKTDYLSGDAFYINTEVFREFFTGGTANTLPGMLETRRTASHRMAEESGNTIVDILIEMNPKTDRLEFRYVYKGYGEKEYAD